MTSNGGLQSDGFTLVREVLAPSQLTELLSVILPKPDSPGVHPAPYALRNLLWDRPQMSTTLAGLGIHDIASKALGGPAFAINALYFDKTNRANWKVPCHQDVMMPVEERVDEPGFGGWTVKAGVPHVEPPADVLAGLVALRIHFDDCPAANGSLSVLPGSHCGGKLRDADLGALGRGSFVDCEAKMGDVLVMRPLLVHRSSAALDPKHRRVLHVVYATKEPGSTVRWKRPVRQ